ncbi:MAG: hypothetical protein JRD03_08485 [Deltaproteobacteria bacterium]|nr:hypothetical protein [Deltaproteobacteria bacterium]
MTSIETSGPRFTKKAAFRIFKVAIFCILMVNLVYYLYEDVTAFLYLAPGSTLFDGLEAFAVTIDYIAWMVLIVLFEMETSAHKKNLLTSGRRLLITGLTAACYVILVYAAYGYTVALTDSYQYEPIESRPACYFANTNFAYLTPEARVIELTEKNCGAFEGKKIFKSPGDNLIATETNIMALRKLSWVDVFNAGAWLLVVMLFQIEVSLERANKLTKHRLIVVMIWKGAAYLVLLFCAIYWTVFSAFIDSWDAWLWLLAFILIDLNMLGLDESRNESTAGSVVEA